MKIIFDKNLSTEHELPIANYFENISDNSLNATKTFHINEGEVVPDISGMIGRKSFTTIQILDGETSLPIIGTYDKIDNFSTSYFEEQHAFTYNITIAKELE